MNQVQLVGNIVRDVELKDAGNTQVARFTVACQRRGKKEDGKPSADFIPCVAFGKVGEIVSKWFGKGKKIGLTGRIQTGNYKNKDGQTIYTTEVIVENVEFVENKQSEQSAANVPVENVAPQNQGTAPAAGQPKADESFMQIPTDTDEMELPFS